MSQDIKWFGDFMGVGYHFHDVHTKLLLIMDKKNNLLGAWKKVIKWWPDDEIRMRLVEDDSSYDFVLYGESRILQTKWGFVKSLQASAHYQRFRDEFDGVAYLGMALYIPKADSYELEIFKYSKRVTDVKFLKKDEVNDEVLSQAMKALHATGKN